MNAVRRLRPYEVDVANAETTDAKIDALREGLEDVKKDVRDLRTDVNSLRDKVDKNYSEMHKEFAAVRSEMHAGFAAIRGEMHAGFNTLRESISGLEKSVAALRAMMKTALAIITLGATFAIIFFTAGNALNWFKSAPRGDAKADTHIAGELKGSTR